jgi:hypothetical protein
MFIKRCNYNQHKDASPPIISFALEKHYLTWMEMIEGYSARELSVPSDKFAGVSGLASELAYLLGDPYVAGLWRKDLWRGLCWRWKSNDIAHIPKMKMLKS